jgi:hypothetical protein
MTNVKSTAFTRPKRRSAVVRYFQGLFGVVLGIWACLGCSESFWEGLRLPLSPDHPNPVMFALYGLGRTFLIVHDAIGIPLTVMLMILSSLFLLWRAFREDSLTA